MSHSKVHSRGNVPFSWEKKPGISKADGTETKCLMEEDLVLKLPPPPCLPLVATRKSLDSSFQIPPPPGSNFQGLSRSSSAKGGLRKKEEDPFLAAFKECTKSSRKGKTTSFSHRLFDLRSGIMRSLFGVVPCKNPGSCAVRDDNLVRVSQLPYYDVYDRDRSWINTFANCDHLFQFHIWYKYRYMNTHTYIYIYGDEFYIITAVRVTTTMLITNANMDKKINCYSQIQ